MAGLRRVSHLSQTLVAARGSRLSQEALDLGVEVRPVRWGGAVDAAALSGLVRTLGEGWDVVHAHDSHALQSALVARALVGRSAPLIAARRVDFPTRRPGIWRRADRIVAVSQCIRDVLVRQGIEQSRIEVIYSGIDPADLQPSRVGVLRDAAGAAPADLLVAAVGALVPHKDHATFIRAASIVAGSRPGIRFAVFGEGPLRESLEALVFELDLKDRFCLAGHIPDTIRSLGDLDVFVMPGLPIVATSAGGLGELAGDAFLPIDPGRPDQLARQIQLFVDAPEARKKAGLRANQRGQAFSAEAMVAGTIGCYEQVTHRLPAPTVSAP